MDELWHHVKQSEYRALYLSNQLQEGRHDAKGDDSVAQLQAAPYESQQVAQAETARQQGTGNEGEACAPLDFPLQVLLHVVELSCYPFAAFQRTEYSIMLHTFLDEHLNAGVLFANVTSHVA